MPSPAALLVTHLTRRSLAFLVTGVLSTLFFAWVLLRGWVGFDSPASPWVLVFLLLNTLALLYWVRSPIPTQADLERTSAWRLVGLFLLVVPPLFLLPMVFGGRILYALPVFCLVALVLLRRPVTRREWVYAGLLAAGAGVAGWGNRAVHGFSPVAWAILQLPLVICGLLCGWKVLQASGLSETGVGYSQGLARGWRPALRSFGTGLLLGLPWALANILLGGSGRDGWVTAWWQPLTAIQPAIAEEAWGRMAVIPLLFLIFRRAARPRTAFTAALFLGAYWFAYLHTGMGLEGLLSTLLTGTLFALPIAAVCLYRDLESAIGYHFLVDFLRFFYAFLG